MNLRDTHEFQVGQAGEKLVDKWLQDRGWYTVRSMEFAGDDKAPSMFGPSGEALVLPDLDAAKNGTRRWVEVKTKTRADWSRNYKCHVHGISSRLLEHYSKVAKITGTSVWLAVFEVETRSLLGLVIAGPGRTAPRYYYEGPKMGRHGMAFFDRARMSLLATFPSPS